MIRVFDRKRPLAKSWWLACFLIVQVAGLTQFYPYAHLHRVHDEDGSRVVLSVHPPSVGDEFAEVTPEDEHHHAIDHLTLDCHFCKRLLKQLQRRAEIAVPSLDLSKSAETAVEFNRPMKPQLRSSSCSISLPDFRAPPTNS